MEEPSVPGKDQASNLLLVGPAVWQPVIDGALTNADSTVAAIALRLVEWMHSRHIGLTPTQAVGLAELIVRGEMARTDSGIWSHLVQLLRHQPQNTPDKGAEVAPDRRRRGLHLVIRSNPAYFLNRVVAPLVSLACKSIGRVYLFAEDSVDTAVTSDDYKTYCADLDNSILALLRNEPDNSSSELDLFWMHRSAAISSFTRAGLDLRRLSHNASAPRTSRPSPIHVNLPEADPAGLSFLYKLVPDEMEVRGITVKSPKLRIPFDLNTRARQHQGGVHGIRLSRGEEDIQQILFSELFNHPAVLADKLLNTGYLIKERMPRFRPYRHLLLVGFMPPELRETLAGEFFKACWVDFLMRLSYRLLQAKLTKTDYFWLEGDAAGRLHVAHMSVENFSEYVSAIPSSPDKNSLYLFMNMVRATPMFTDRRTGPGKALSAALPTDPLVWPGQAWKLATTSDHQGGNLIVKPDTYLATHQMLFFPGVMLRDKNGGVRDSEVLLSARQTLKGSPNHQSGASVTWDDSAVTGGAPVDSLVFRWGSTSLKTNAELFEPSVNEAKLAGRLIRVWMEQLDREVFHD